MWTQYLNCVTDRTRMVMIANPDNPTGSYLTGSEIRRLHAGLPGNVLLVLDSAYFEYVEADDYESPVALVEEKQNVIMTRTFSKIYGLAGMRLGWAYAPAAIADMLGRVGITFPVSGPAYSSGMAALQDTDHTAHVYAETVEVRRWFGDALAEHGFIVHPHPDQLRAGRHFPTRIDPPGWPTITCLKTALQRDG